MRSYRKLVRDRIPEIILAEGNKPAFRIMSDEEYTECLKRKLTEEVNEFLCDESVEELADIYEVFLAILECKSISIDELRAIQKDKAKEKGRFSKKIFLDYVIDGSE